MYNFINDENLRTCNIERIPKIFPKRIPKRIPKLPKYFDQDCLKIFCLPSTLPMLIHHWNVESSGKDAHLVQKR